MKYLNIGQKPDQEIRLLEGNPKETVVLAKDALPKMPVWLKIQRNRILKPVFVRRKR